jgi:hypothetical protein
MEHPHKISTIPRAPIGLQEQYPTTFCLQSQRVAALADIVVGNLLPAAAAVKARDTAERVKRAIQLNATIFAFKTNNQY